MLKEIMRNFEHIQNYVVQEHHHQKCQVSYHVPGPGGQEKGSIQFVLSENELPRPCTIWPMHFMVEKLILDKLWETILLLFPPTCSVGPEVVLGQPE